MKILTKESLSQAVGKEVGVSQWFDVTQENVNLFADV
ncbi:MAG: acyl dehydratase, partial [Arenicella sp.]